MKPAPFDYVKPASAPQVLDALAKGGRILAGGQSLVPMLNLRLAPVDVLVDIKALDELRGVAETPQAIRYGALTTHAAFEDGAVPDATRGLLPHVAARIAFRSVRTRGTLGGALALADPSADWVTCMMALEARMHILGSAGRRVVPAAEFILGAYWTALAEGEVLAAIEVPRLAASARWGHSKVAARVGEYADSLAIAVLDRSVRTGRLALGAADGAPLLLDAAVQAALAGADDAALRQLLRQGIEAAERGFSTAKLMMHTTTALRALREAMRP